MTVRLASEERGARRFSSVLLEGFGSPRTVYVLSKNIISILTYGEAKKSG